jgi:hypothetical protein
MYSTTGFDETSITWNNCPPLIDFLAEFKGAGESKWLTFSSPELTAYVDRMHNAGKPVCFATRCSLWLPPGTITWYYHSKETDPFFAPELIYNSVTYTPEEDTRVDESHPNTNFDRDYLWNCDNGSPMRQVTYLQFPVPVSVEENERYSAIFMSSPNPFHLSTNISYGVLPIDAGKRVTLSVYDICGKCIETLVHGVGEPGEYRVSWNGENADNANMATGVYFLKLNVGNKTSVIKTMQLR